MTEQTIGIVGGGIVGLAIGRELARRRPGTSIIVFEKEDRLAAHQTGHNSGVVHAGIYYKPGSLKAELCTRGRLLLKDYCAERGLPYDGVRQARRGRRRTPNSAGWTPWSRRPPRTRCRVCGASSRPRSPRSNRTRPDSLRCIRRGQPSRITSRSATAFAEDIEAAGGRILLSTRVTGVRSRPGAVELCTESGLRRVDRLVVCAGLQADRMSRFADGEDGPRIVPFRGEYMAVSEEKRDLVRGMIYPVPDPRYPFLGVHFTRRVSGELEVGPNAVFALKREGYRRAASTSPT